MRLMSPKAARRAVSMRRTSVSGAKGCDWSKYADEDIERFLGELHSEREKRRREEKREALRKQIEQMLKEQGMSWDNVFGKAGKGKAERHSPYRRDSTRRFRKRGRSLLLALGGTFALGLVVVYLSWLTDESGSSRSEAAGIERAVVGGNDLSDNGAGTGGAQEASSSGSRPSLALKGPNEESPELNPDMAAGLPAKHESALAQVSQAKLAGGALPAFPDVKHDQDPKLAKVAQEAAKVPRTYRLALPTREPSQTAGQAKADARLSSSVSPKASPSADKRVARSYLTSRMHGREPTDQLGSSVMLAGHQDRTVFYFTELRDLAGHTVLHRWELNGKVVTILPFEVKGQRWRIYSRNTLTSNEQGNWRVVVADTNGTVLASQNFVLVQ